MVKQALESKDLLAKTPDPALPAIEVVITDIRVRSNFAAIMFGFMAGGQDDARMGWLYESFAKELVTELTGAVAK